MRPRITLRCLTRRGISIASAPLSGRGCGADGGGGLAAPVLHRDLALVDPDLDADAPVGRVRVDLAVADVRAQRAQRDATFAVPLPAAHLRAPEAAGQGDPDALGARLHRPLDRLLHRLLVGDAAGQLLGDVEGDEVRVQLGLADLADLELDLALGQVADLLAQDLDVLAAAPDHDPGLRRVDRHRDVVDAALDLDAAHARVGKAPLEQPADRDVLLEEGRVLLVGIPLGGPRSGVAQAEAVRMDLVSHA